MCFHGPASEQMDGLLLLMLMARFQSAVAAFPSVHPSAWRLQLAETLYRDHCCSKCGC